MARTGDTLTRQTAPRLDPQAAPPPRRGLLSSFSMAHGLMVLSGLLAFLLIASVLDDRSERLVVATARGDIAAGTTITADLVEPARLPAGTPLADRLATLDEVRRGRWTVSQPIAAGDPIRRSDLLASGERSTLRSMSIPVARENAVGGALRVGDRVDVIDVVEGQSAFVVSGAQVTKLPATSVSGGLTRGVERDFFVVVQVSAEEALALAEALADGKVDIVRSTGANPAPATTDVRLPTGMAPGDGPGVANSGTTVP